MPFKPGFRGKPQPPAVWQNSYNTAVGTAGPNVAAPANFRVFVPQAGLLVTGGTKVRLTLTAAVAFAGGEQPLNLDKVYFGQAAAGATNAAPSFAATPIQVFFGGGPTCSVALGGSIVTDELIMSLPAAQGVILSGWSNRNYSLRHVANAAAYYSTKAGPDEAASVVVTGFSVNTAAVAVISKIEVFK